MLVQNLYIFARVCALNDIGRRFLCCKFYNGSVMAQGSKLAPADRVLLLVTWLPCPTPAFSFVSFLLSPGSGGGSWCLWPGREVAAFSCISFYLLHWTDLFVLCFEVILCILDLWFEVMQLGEYDLC